MPRKKRNEKQEETLRRMQETRKEDTRCLREIIESKLKWAKDEKVKGIKVIEQQIKQLKENQTILITFVQE